MFWYFLNATAYCIDQSKFFILYAKLFKRLLLHYFGEG